MGSSITDHLAGNVMADTEWQTVLMHQDIGDFLTSSPVVIEFFQGSILVHHKGIQNLIEKLQHIDSTVAQCSVEFLLFRIQHPCFKVVSTENHSLGLSDDFTSFSTTVIYQAWIAFLRHGRGDVGIVSSFLQKDPRTRLSVLDH